MENQNVVTERSVMTLGIVYREGAVLLGLKKRGFAEGLWNGFGGKVELGETLEESLIRECREEAGIIPVEYKKVGIVEGVFQEEAKVREFHVYRVISFEGVVTESEEMKPQWFLIKDIPWSSMWESDTYWYPLFLKGEKFKAVFDFSPEKMIRNHCVSPVDSL